MDLIARIFLIFAAVVICTARPNDSKSLPDPSVFEADPPANLLKFFPPSMDKPIIPNLSWMPFQNIGKNMKFDWFHFPGQPQGDVGIDKNNDKDSRKDTSKDFGIYWKEGIPFFSSDDNTDAENYFPSYYNVFLSNAYPNFMSMPGFQNSPNDKNKQSDEIKERSTDLKQASEIQKVISDKVKSDENIKLSTEESKNIEDVKVETIKNTPLLNVDEGNIKLEKSLEKNGDSIEVIPDSHPIPFIIFPKDYEDDTQVKEESIKGKDEKKVVNSVPEENENDDIIIPERTTEKVIKDEQTEDIKEENTIPKSENLQDGSKPITLVGEQLPSEKPQEVSMDNPIVISESQTLVGQLQPVKVVSHVEVEVESWEIDTNPDLNLMPDNYLYNILKKGKPVVASAQAAKMFVPLDNAPKSESRKSVSDSKIVNQSDPSTMGQNIKVKNLQNPSNNEESSPISENLYLQPILGNIPENQGNLPFNPSYINAMPYGMNNQNNYPDSSGQPVLVSPYNNNQLNYAPVNTGAQSINYRGYYNNGQNVQNPGQGNILDSNNIAMMYPSINGNYNNNMGSAGVNPGNLYSIVPNPGYVRNTNAGPNQYMNGNTQNPSYQMVPVYSLVPVSNTRDEESEEEHEEITKDTLVIQPK